MDDSVIREQVLPRYGLEGAEVEPWGAGLIHATFRITHGSQRFILQRMNPLFSPAVCDNIRAVTAHLAERGLTTPRLLDTREGQACLVLDGDHDAWRLMSFISGHAFRVVQSTAQAHAAGALVARFHRALQDLDHTFVGLRTGAHDTAAHLSRLRRALAAHPAHRLSGAVQGLAAALLADAQALEPLPALPATLCHGDLKLDNILFAAPEGPGAEQAMCLVDLDTVGPGALAYELGDAWRSWCNRAGEGAVEAELDLEIFSASLDGYQSSLGRSLTAAEARALWLGGDWVSLELAARFAADALEESYFGWDSSRYPGRGEHNLARARGQLSLHRAFVATRAARARALGLTP